MSEKIERFTVAADQAALDDLKARLSAARWPDQIEGSGWDYGTDLGCLRGLVEYWRDEFDWRRHEARINALDNFTTDIDGQNIHFIHARSKHTHALPLLLVHGWPSSIVEFLGVIGPLTDPEAHGGDPADAFHIVAPSLPGYGFSEVTRSRQWDTYRMADALAVLMDRLGYGDYVAQGGDFGSVIATEMAIRYADRVRALHTTLPMALPQEDLDDLTERERADVAAIEPFVENEAAYQRMHGTKPQTLGFGLNDSPIGLAAWIIEKFHSWSDCGGDVESSFSKDDLLANITIYWLTRTITSSMRLYYETFKNGRVSWLGQRIEVPVGVARFPEEMAQFRYPRSWVEKIYNVTQWTNMPRGGHFAAMEEPELFVEDLRKFFGTVR